MTPRPLLAAVAMGVLAACLWPEVAQAKDRFEVGEAVQPFTLRRINPDGSSENLVSIEKFFAGGEQAKKATLLSFFATYCEPCKKEMPYLAALYDTYQDQGLQVLLVSIDKEAAKIEEAKSLAEQVGVKFPVLSDRFNIVARRYFIEKLPCVYIIDGEGKVSMVNVGYSNDVSKVLLDGVRTLIGEPVSDPIPESLAKYIPGVAPTTVAVSAKADAAGSTETAAATTPPAPPEPAAEDERAVEEDDPKDKKKKRAKRKRRRKR